LEHPTERTTTLSAFEKQLDRIHVFELLAIFLDKLLHAFSLARKVT